MPYVHKSRAGTMQYWPRKRAARIYPNISIEASKVLVDGVRPLVFAAYKAGMTHTIIVDTIKGSPSFNQPISVPVSVLDAPPLFVIGVRCYTRVARNEVSSFDIYTQNIPKEMRLLKKSKHKTEDIESKKSALSDVRLIVATQPTKSGMSKKTPEIFEVDVSGALEDRIKYAKEKLGKELTINDTFNEGQFVDVTAITKGHGFQGVVKRFGTKLQGRKNEQSHRQIGVHGTEHEGRIRFTVPMAGQHGFHRRTEHNKQIFKIANDGFAPKGGFVRYGAAPKTFVFVKGSVGGPRKRLVFLRAPLRAPSKGYPITIQEIGAASQQGARTR
ncbi:MAG: 50S ribosomal protein L3 [Candidatus Aenigmarchaeota archaeon]|nr:50S ribosomal protein L3 [Candidatus Aenigmarchaeota archaeon]